MSRATIINSIHESPEAFHACLTGSDQRVKHDYKLRSLMVSAGCLAAVLFDPGWSRNHLSKIYGLCSGWALALGEKSPSEKIYAERERQEQLLKEGRFLFTCASPVTDPVRKLRVLTEEIGEVAEAIDQLEIYLAYYARPHKKGIAIRNNHLKTEVIQTAAVCVAWLESLEGK